MRVINTDDLRTRYIVSKPQKAIVIYNGQRIPVRFDHDYSDVGCLHCPFVGSDGEYCKIHYNVKFSEKFFLHKVTRLEEDIE